jgi:hypothetical protein
MTGGCISKVADVYWQDKSAKLPFRPHGAMG